MATKVCSKCKREQDISCFWKDKSRKKDGLCVQCISCKKQYCKDNNKQIKQHRKDKSENKKNYDKQYRIDHIEQRTLYEKQYNKDNTEQKTKYNKQYFKNSALFETCSKKLEAFEKIKQCSENLKLLEVKCAYCNRWFKPTNLQVSNRLQVFNGNTSGENRLYCSENCKQACPTYNQSKYPKGFKQATSREVVPLLRQLVLKRDNYTCQKCGATTKTAQLHVHHITSYAQNKMQANDPDSCITLCKKCHKKVHQQEGCRYVDLQCHSKK